MSPALKLGPPGLASGAKRAKRHFSSGPSTQLRCGPIPLTSPTSTLSPTAARRRAAPTGFVVTSGSPTLLAFHHDPSAPHPASAPTAIRPAPSVSAPCPWLRIGGGE